MSWSTTQRAGSERSLGWSTRGRPTLVGLAVGLACGLGFATSASAEERNKLVIYVHNLTAHVLKYDSASSHYWTGIPGCDGVWSTTSARYRNPELILPGGVGKIKAVWSPRFVDYKFKVRFHYRTDERHKAVLTGESRGGHGDFNWIATGPTEVNLSIKKYESEETRLWATIH